MMIVQKNFMYSGLVVRWVRIIRHGLFIFHLRLSQRKCRTTSWLSFILLVFTFMATHQDTPEASRQSEANDKKSPTNTTNIMPQVSTTLLPQVQQWPILAADDFSQVSGIWQTKPIDSLQFQAVHVLQQGQQSIRLQAKNKQAQ
ncbi:Uncharacterised protein [Candidatus Venteria ishoeyi]|uniref:Uncharacterized protein n=2 Tax=Candidatus Venteria ishoeyi TaxID=1899563 RepID=A0A1H6FAR9_9GAMM|nr:Uncharacterised protein [Candidatus Venteria ishoeyi]